MAVDRGGLQYGINIQISKIEDLNKLREQIKGLDRDVRGLASSSRERAKASREQAKADREQTKASRDKAKAARDEVTQQRRVAAAAKSASLAERQILNAKRQFAVASQRASDAQLKELRVQTQAQNILTRSAERQAVINKLRQAGYGPNGQKQLTGFQKILQRVGKSTQGLVNDGNRAAFTFRRLFGIFAAFQAIRLGANQVRNLVTEMISFNARVEEAVLGIGSIITATSEVRDSFGDTVSAAERLALAQGIAREQTEQLRAEALATKATFEELLDTFQVALAPGIAAGLDINQVRRFTVQISQAASALGLAGNQLSEEIRSILSGTIQARTTRIAVALGITNEDIRRAREAGVLFDFLNDRFSAFSEAGRVAQDTFGALAANLRGAFSLVAGTAGEQAFEGLKQVLRDVTGLLRVIDRDTGKISPSPQAVAAFKVIGDTLNRIFADISKGIRETSPEDITKALKDIFTILGQIAEIVVALGKGAVRAIRTIAGIINATTGGGAVSQEVKDLTEATAKWGIIWKSILGLGIVGFLIKIAKGFLRIRDAVKSDTGQKFLGKLASWFEAAARGSGTLAKGLGRVSVALSRLAVRAFPPLAAALAGLEAGGRIGQLLFTDRDLSRTQSIFTVLKDIITARQRIVDLQKQEAAFTQNNQELLRWTRIRNAVNGTGDAMEGIIDRLIETPGLMDKVRARGEAGFKALSDAVSTGSTESLLRLRDELGATDDVLRDLAGSDSLAGLEAAFERTARGALPAFTSVLDGLPPIVVSSNKAIDEAQAKLTEYSKTLRDAAIDAEAARQSLRQPITAEFVSLEAEQTKQLLRLNEDLEKSKQQQLAELQRIQTEQARIAQATSQLSQADREDLESVRRRIEAIRQQQQYIKGLETQRTLQAQIAESAKDPAAAAAARKELDFLNRSLAIGKSSLQNQRESLDAAIQSRFTTAEAAKQAQDIISQSITLSGQEKAVREGIAEVEQSLAGTVAEVNKEYAERRRTLFETLQAEQQTAAQEARFALRRSQIQLEYDSGRISSAQQAVALAKLEAQEVAASTQQRIDALVAERQALQFRADNAQTQEEANTYRGLIALINQRIEAEQRLGSVQNARQAEALRLSQQQLRTWELGGTFFQEFSQSATLAWQGMIAGLRSVQDEIRGPFQLALDAVKTAVEGVAEIGSQAIVDMFDPTKNNSWEDIRAQFGRLLQEIAQMMIREFIKVAIVRTALGLGAAGATGGGAAGTAVSGAIGLAGGGSVPNAPVGFRPASVPSSDTTPIWATPGEFMMQKSVVGQYGTGFFQALNEGRLDLSDLVSRFRPSSRPSRRPIKPRTGYATGGEITPNAAGAAPGSGTMIVTASQVEKIVGGGFNGFLRAAQRNKQEVKAILGG